MLGMFVGLVAAITWLLPGARAWVATDRCIDRGGRWIDSSCELFDSSSVQQAVDLDSTTLLPNRRAVLGGSGALLMLGVCGEPVAASQVSGTWLPTSEHVELGDSLIQHRLREDAATVGLPFIAGYYRQFAGFIVDGAERLYINGFHSTHTFAPWPEVSDTTSWRTHFVGACGGGPFYFSAAVDPSERSLVSFDFNSPM
jgi:hypothetical protein